ncbi:hypothetical protein TcBrA4_0037080 [Trypanosoma cruzi]|nr:hypothetical protein TcBrA4_0037080 [Trypanosoma cruzi]
MCAVAYNVRYTAFKSPSPVSARFSGYCPWHGGGHTMMPMKKSFQELAKSTIKDAAFKEAPIGGWCPYSSCTTQKCEWVFFTGLMNGTAVEKATFFKGTVYNGLKYTESIPGMYNNFLDGFQPVSFFKASGRTITKMVSDGIGRTRSVITGTPRGCASSMSSHPRKWLQRLRPTRMALSFLLRSSVRYHGGWA